MYGTLVTADAYHLQRGNAEWAAASEAVRTAALWRAADWLDGSYELRFPGHRSAGASQARAWPRDGATDRSGLSLSGTPDAVLSAAYEAALREVRSPGSLTRETVASEIVTKEKVGPVEITYAGPQEASSSRVGPAVVVSSVEALLAAILLDPRGTPAALVV